MGTGKTFLNITEFFTGKKQGVTVDGQCSEYKNVTSGVPHGSVLGPLTASLVLYLGQLLRLSSGGLVIVFYLIHHICLVVCL